MIRVEPFLGTKKRLCLQGGTNKERTKNEQRTNKERTDGRTNEREMEQMDRWTDGRKDRGMHYVWKCYLIEIILTSFNPAIPEYALNICNIR